MNEVENWVQAIESLILWVWGHITWFGEGERLLGEVGAVYYLDRYFCKVCRQGLRQDCNKNIDNDIISIDGIIAFVSRW